MVQTVRVQSQPRTAYQRIADDLRAGIADGTYPVGERLPSLQTLVRTTGTSTSTVRAAYQQLAAEGLVESLHGAGMFVTATPAMTQDAGALADRVAALEGKVRDQDAAIAKLTAAVERLRRGKG